MKMDPERFRKVEELFNQALEQKEEERRAFLARTCRDDPDMLKHVRALLESHAGASAFIERPAFESVDGLFDRSGKPLPEGYAFGPYKIVRVIDSGGMGTIYEAMEDHPQRRVALKVLHANITSQEILKRFRQEAQILALLRHPGIAEIYSAGTHETDGTGLPYIAMEFIPRALAITSFARERDLDTRSKLELFLGVLDAVSHGHRNGIVHRDLKPANILVDSSSDQPVPKVIDFGVARVLDHELGMTSLHTIEGQFLGTLRYMSPEQIAGDISKVGIQSDVYSLGIILFELLCNRPPYDLANKAITRVIKIIEQRPPEAPSKIDHSLAGDLEILTLKALEKERSNRYASIDEFAADIRRFLNREPIKARAPGPWNRFALYCRRNQLLVGAAITLLIVLTAGIVVSTGFAVRSVNKAKEATESAREAEEVTDFLTTILSSARPEVAWGRELTVREVLDDTAERIERDLAGQPKLQGIVRQIIGGTYHDLGHYDEAEKLLRSALKSFERSIPGNEKRILDCKFILACTLSQTSRLEEAERLLEEVREGFSRLLGEDHPDTLIAVQETAGLLIKRGEHDEAQSLLEKIYDDLCRLEGEDDPRSLSVLNSLAANRFRQGHNDEAEILFKKLLDGYIRIEGPEHLSVFMAKTNVAGCYLRSGRFDEAESLFLDVYEQCRTILGEDHPNTVGLLFNLGTFYTQQGRPALAESYYLKALKYRREKLGQSHPETIDVMLNLARLYFNTGCYDDCRQLVNEIHPLLSRDFPGAAPRKALLDLIDGKLKQVRQDS